MDPHLDKGFGKNYQQECIWTKNNQKINQMQHKENQRMHSTGRLSNSKKENNSPEMTSNH